MSPRRRRGRNLRRELHTWTLKAGSTAEACSGDEREPRAQVVLVQFSLTADDGGQQPDELVDNSGERPDPGGALVMTGGPPPAASSCALRRRHQLPPPRRHRATPGHRPQGSGRTPAAGFALPGEGAFDVRDRAVVDDIALSATIVAPAFANLAR